MPSLKLNITFDTKAVVAELGSRIWPSEPNWVWI